MTPQKIISGSLRRTFRTWRALKRIARVSLFPDRDCRFIKAVYFRLPDHDPEYLAYQAYYVAGLREKVPLKPVPSHGGPGSSGVELGRDSFASTHSTHVGQYLFSLRNGTTIKVAIDAHDHRNIRSPEILAWSDIYFKTNYWPEMGYEHKVQPLVNGNANLSTETILTHRKLRQSPKLLDMVFISRLWAGGDAYLEHNLRFFEKLAEVGGKTKIQAIFCGFDPSSPEYVACCKRLDRAGVSHSFEHLTYHQLMTLSAQARCVVLRLGVSLCIPWRMVDLLCLGACVVLDNVPYPAWPVSLAHQKNFYSLDLRVRPEAEHASDSDYAGMVEKVHALLADPALQQTIRENNQAYFERHAHPVRVAEYLIKTVSALSAR